MASKPETKFINSVIRPALKKQWPEMVLDKIVGTVFNGGLVDLIGTINHGHALVIEAKVYPNVFPTALQKHNLLRWMDAGAIVALLIYEPGPGQVCLVLPSKSNCTLSFLRAFTDVLPGSYLSTRSLEDYPTKSKGGGASMKPKKGGC